MCFHAYKKLRVRVRERKQSCVFSTWAEERGQKSGLFFCTLSHKSVITIKYETLNKRYSGNVNFMTTVKDLSFSQRCF